MNQVTISQLKNSLSAYLRKVAAGETVLILDRDKPVAQLQPVSNNTSADSRLLRLESAGVLRRGGNGVTARERLAELPFPKARSGLVQAVLDEREEDPPFDQQS